MASDNAAHDAPEYDIRSALQEAAALLNDEFGQADQRATVELATFLWRSHLRDEFERRNPQPDDISYAGGAVR